MSKTHSYLRIDTSTLNPSWLAQSRIWEGAAWGALQGLQTPGAEHARWTGWYNWPTTHGYATLESIYAWQKSLAHSYDILVVAGIGGSFAGCRAVDEALSHTFRSYLPTTDKRIPIVYAGHNLSEADLVELLDLLGSRQPLINVVSKSGTTTETSVAFRILRQYMEDRYGQEEASHRIIVTTDASKGSLGPLAKERGYKRFVIPEDVGGRFSVFTAVGLVPLVLAGHNVEALLDGANTLFKDLGETLEVKRSPTSETPGLPPPLALACIRRAAWEGGKRVEVLAYHEPKLAALTEWWKQLFGESEGKDGKGLFPAGMAYSTDLHSLGQYLQEGFPSILESFLIVDHDDSSTVGGPLGVERRIGVPVLGRDDDGVGYLEGRYIGDINRSAMQAARLAHSDRGLPTLAIHLPRLDAFSLGYLMAMFQVTCAVSGQLLEVNPYDQPGVEAYKENLFALMGRPGFEAKGEELRGRLPK